MVGVPRDPDQLAFDVSALLNAGSFVEAVQAIAAGPINADTLTPPLSQDDISLVRDAESDAAALFALGAGIWSLDGFELLGLEVLGEAAVRGSSDAADATGEALAWLGLPELATEWLSESASNSVRGVWLAGLLGESLFSAGHGPDAALPHLLRAYAEYPDFGVPLAKALRATGEVDRARSVLIELSDRGIGPAAMLLGNVELDDYEDEPAAERAYRRGVELEDGFSAYNLGKLLLSQGRLSEARDAYRRARELGDLTAPPNEVTCL